MNIILLAAGRGSRLGGLTERIHKALLPVAGQPTLQFILDAAIAANPRDIVIVTGYRADDVVDFVETRYPARVRAVHNDRYASDTNILSTHLGVEALKAPSTGYLIIETDVVMEPAGWRMLMSCDGTETSKWATRGTYSRDLTGGALRDVDGGKVDSIVYAPTYEPAFQGWKKLLGALYVGPGQVASDRSLRASAIRDTISQYYMDPWIRNLSHLPCMSLDLSAYFAASFNDSDAYTAADRAFSLVQNAGGGLHHS